MYLYKSTQTNSVILEHRSCSGECSVLSVRNSKQKNQKKKTKKKSVSSREKQKKERDNIIAFLFVFHYTDDRESRLPLGLYTFAPSFLPDTHAHVRSTCTHTHRLRISLQTAEASISFNVPQTHHVSLSVHIYNPRIGNRISFIIFLFRMEILVTIVRHLLSTHIQTLTQIKKDTHAGILHICYTTEFLSYVIGCVLTQTHTRYITDVSSYVNQYLLIHIYINIIQYIYSITITRTSTITILISKDKKKNDRF